MDLIANTKVSRFKTSLEKSGEGLWKKIGFHIEESELMIRLHLLNKEQEFVKQTYDVFERVFLESDLYAQFAKEKFTNWYVALDYSDEPFDHIFSSEFLENNWEGDSLDFPYYLEKKIIKSLSNKAILKVSIDVEGGDTCLVNVFVANNISSIDALSDKFTQILKLKFLQNQTKLIPLLVLYQNNEVVFSKLID